MKYESITGILTPVSRMVFGCANDAMSPGKDADELLDAVFDLGINTFDTAEVYDGSEVCLGNWMRRRGNRENVVVITKGCHPRGDEDRVTPEALKEDLEHSLKQLDTDYIDIYLLHRDDFSVPVGPLVEILNEYYDAGKIRAFGGSNWTIPRIEEANAYAAGHGLVPFTVSSPNYSLCEQCGDPSPGSAGGVTIAGPQNEASRQWYRDHHMPAFAYSSLARGMLSGKVKSYDPEGALKVLDEFAIMGYYCPENFARLARAEQLAKEKDATVAQIALAWILNQDLPIFPIVGSSRIETMKKNTAAADIYLSSEEIHWLDEG